MQADLQRKREGNEKKTLQIQIGDQIVKESTSLKTLVEVYDSPLKFREHWNEMKTRILKKLYAFGQVKASLTFLQRKELGQGLILSVIEYCLESTSTCNKSTLGIPRRLLNQAVRLITGNWELDQTQAGYRSLGWLNIE